MAVIAFIEDSDVIKKILKHLGLWNIKRKPRPTGNVYLWRAPPIYVFPAYDEQPGPCTDDYIADPVYPAVPRLAGLGKIISISQETQEVIISFDGRNVVYDFADLDEIVLAYAVSVHKSQGSEYPAVVIPLLTQHYILLQRNLIYTAVTRGKNLVVIVGSKKALAIGVNNNKTQKRFTCLKQRLA